MGHPASCQLPFAAQVRDQESPGTPSTAAGSALTSLPAQAADDKINRESRQVFRTGLIPAEQDVLDELPGATEYVLDITLPDDLEKLQGHQAVRYTNREDVELTELFFRLFTNTNGGSTQVSGVKVDGEAVQPEVQFNESALMVPLPVPLKPGESVMVEMDFQVSIPREMGGNYGLFGYFDGVLVLDEFYPAIPVYDAEGWNVESPPPNADMPFYDASLYQVTVNAPRELQLVTSGVELSRQEKADRQVVTFAAGPARGFYIAGSDQFLRSSRQVGDTLLNVYTTSGQEQVENVLDVAEGALEAFNDRLGLYPYSELDIVSTPMQALGMEYPGIVAISSRLFGDPSRVNYLESTIAHEIGHQWFFNMVGSDQIDNPWLDEAITQYITYLYYLDFRGQQAAEGFSSSWQDRWSRVNDSNIPIGLPAAQYSEIEYSAIVYGRGPIFIQELAKRMGQDKFDSFLKQYFLQNKWEIGTPQEFQQSAEEFCTCDLTDIFNKWVYP